MVAFTITPQTASVFIGGKMRMVAASSPNYPKLVEALRQKPHDESLIRDYVSLDTFLAKISFGDVAMSNDQVRYKGQPVHNALADKMLAMLSEGFDLEPLSRFMTNVMENPYEKARKGLYTWLERGNMPITEYGHFIAFKRVDTGFMDFHSRTVKYELGKVVKKDIAVKDSIYGGACGHGLHFCSFDYLDQFHSGKGRVLIVAINPRDVIGVEENCTTKGQTTQMFVLHEMPESELRSVYESTPVYQRGAVNGVNSHDALDRPEPAPEPAPEPKQEAPDNFTYFDALADKSLGNLAQNLTSALAGQNEPAKPPLDAEVTNSSELNIFKTSDGRVITEANVRNAVDAAKSNGKGVLEVARLLGVAKSTYQGWAKKLGLR